MWAHPKQDFCDTEENWSKSIKWHSQIWSVIKFMLAICGLVLILLLTVNCYFALGQIETMQKQLMKQEEKIEMLEDVLYKFVNNNDDPHENRFVRSTSDNFHLWSKTSENVADMKTELEQVKNIVGMVGNLPVSCDGYFVSKDLSSGFYHIDPDGKDNGVPPVTVFCNFETGTTEIRHNMEGPHEIDACPGDKCFNLNFDYKPTKEQLEAVISTSELCRQELIFDCFLAKLENIACWRDRHGQEQHYFSGQNYGNHICECGLKNNCYLLETMNVCNCDQKDPFWRQDAGFITNQTALPIMAVEYGHITSELQKATVTVGHLQCKGSQKRDQTGRSCESITKQGRPSGYYIVDGNNDPLDGIGSRHLVTYCNTNIPLSADETRSTNVGFVESMTEDANVVVQAQIVQPVTVLKNETLKFTHLLKNTGRAFDINTSTFVAPRCAMYKFVTRNMLVKEVKSIIDMSKYFHVFIMDTDGQIRTRHLNAFYGRGAEINLNKGAKCFLAQMAVDSKTLPCSNEDPCKLSISSIARPEKCLI